MFSKFPIETLHNCRRRNAGLIITTELPVTLLLTAIKQTSADFIPITRSNCGSFAGSLLQLAWYYSSFKTLIKCLFIKSIHLSGWRGSWEARGPWTQGWASWSCWTPGWSPRGWPGRRRGRRWWGRAAWPSPQGPGQHPACRKHLEIRGHQNTNGHFARE